MMHFQPVIDQDFLPDPPTYDKDVTIRERVLMDGKLVTKVSVYSRKPVELEKGKSFNEKGEVHHVDMMWEYPLISETITD